VKIVQAVDGRFIAAKHSGKIGAHKDNFGKEYSLHGIIYLMGTISIYDIDPSS